MYISQYHQASHSLLLGQQYAMPAKLLLTTTALHIRNICMPLLLLQSSCRAAVSAFSTITTPSFRIPHKPPAGSLRVLHAPVCRGGIRRASKTKINNLGTGEFVSNPPFSKKIVPPFPFRRLLLAGTMDLKKIKTWNF